MTVLEGLYQYFLACPLLAAERRLNVDFLPADQREYSISLAPSATVLRRYLDGSAKKQLSVIFGSSEYIDQTALQNLANAEFYEQLSAWIDQNGRKRIYPDIGAGKQVLSFSCVTAGYLHNRDDSGHAKYQIQINLTYFEGGKK